ncbi:MAG: enoyl-CoA hydratase-related protein, partial [Sphingobium sp.]
MTTIQFDTDADGIATLTIDVPGQSMNVIGPDFIADLSAAIDRIKSEDAIKGAVICSGKASGFMGGMDLKNMQSMLPEGSEGNMTALFEKTFVLNDLFRRLETCGKPIACAIEGTCVGGGFELALACHRRIVADDSKVQLGLPEILVGLFPGGGGSQRFPRITGVQTALMYILQGKLFRPQEALGLKVVDELVPSGNTVAAAKTWLKANPAASVQPWDQKGYRFPGGAGGFNPAFVQTFIGATAMTMKQTQRNLNGPLALLSAVYEG